jgi:hypothetical protein
MSADSGSSEEYVPEEGSDDESSELDEAELLHRAAPRARAGGAASDEDRGGGGLSEEDEEDEPDFFTEQLDPLSLVTEMHAQRQGGGAGQQPYEVLAARKRAARRELADAEAEVLASCTAAVPKHSVSKPKGRAPLQVQAVACRHHSLHISALNSVLTACGPGAAGTWAQPRWRLWRHC